MFELSVMKKTALTWVGQAHVRRVHKTENPIKKNYNYKSIRCLMGMTITIKTTSYDLEAELPGLGWLKDGCSADSLKGKSNNIKKNNNNEKQKLTCKFQLASMKK